MQFKHDSQLNHIQQSLQQKKFKVSSENKFKSVASSPYFKPTHISPPHSKERIYSALGTSRDASLKEIKERTYVLPTLIETDAARRETFKFFVNEDDHKNPEKEKKMKIIDFYVKRDTDLEEIQIQKNARVNVLESLKKKSKGTMYMSELWDSGHYIRVLRASGLGKIIDQIRRSRYQGRSSVGRKLENMYKTKHSTKMKKDQSTYQEIISSTSRVPESNLNSARNPPTDNPFALTRPKTHSVIFAPDGRTHSIPTTTVHSPGPNSPKMDFMITENEEEKEKIDTMQDYLSPMLIKDRHSLMKVKRSKMICNPPMLKSPISNLSSGTPDLLNIQIFNEYYSEPVSSLTNLDTRPTHRSTFAKQKEKNDLTYQLSDSQSPQRIFSQTAQTEESIPSMFRRKREIGSSVGKLRDITSPFSSPRLLSPKTRSGLEHMEGKLRHIVNDCNAVKRENEGMMEDVMRMQNLLETVTQSKRVSKTKKESKIAQELSKQDNKALKHYRQLKVTPGPRISKKTMFTESHGML